MNPRKTTRRVALEKLHEWRTPIESERFWRQVLVYVWCRRISLQGLMEVAGKDSQKKNAVKVIAKRVELLLRPNLWLLAYLRNGDLRKISSTIWLRRQKPEMLTILLTLFDLGLKLQASNLSFLLPDTFLEQPPKYWFTIQISVSPRKRFLDFEVT